MSEHGSDDNRALRLRITGRVQGVGFRESMREVANALGVTGWVRNRLDGSVEAFAQGPTEALEQLLAWSHRGPPGANVREVLATEAEKDNALFTFTRWPTE